MELKFNIIYTTGTVTYLRLFAFSLLKWSDCSFRLVANGCSPEEKRLLKEFCRGNPRLEFLAIPNKTMMRHGQALSYLQKLERSETFCFMDSDILVTGDFMNEFTPYLGQYTGIFSGSPLWCLDEEQILLEIGSRVASGWQNRTDTGLCLGSSYFAIYDNRILTQFIQSTGIDFRIYRWQDIPVQWHSRIAELGLKKLGYDTGKVLNILLLAQGERLCFVESSTIQHIGGISTYAADESGSLHKRFFRKFNRSAKLAYRRAKRKCKNRIMQVAETQVPKTQNIGLIARRWKPTGRYFTQVLQALFEDRSLPAKTDIDESEIEERIELAAANIEALYEEFRDQLR